MRLLLVDDDDIFGGANKKALSEAGFRYDHAVDGAGATDALDARKYALLIINVRLRDCDGRALVANIRFRENVTPILMLTEEGGVQGTLTALRAGADDCLAKPFELGELVERARALLRRPHDFLGAQLNVGNVTLDTLSRQAFIDGTPLWLSWRELTLLEILMRRPKHLLRKQVIENQIFGLLAGSKANAIEVYVHRLRKSLAESGALVQVHTVRGSGYMLSEIEKRQAT